MKRKHKIFAVTEGKSRLLSCVEEGGESPDSWAGFRREGGEKGRIRAFLARIFLGGNLLLGGK